MLTLLAALSVKWSLVSTLRPTSPSADLFGRSAAICPETQRIAIGAEWEDSDRSGGIYIFDYDRDKKVWSQSANLRHPDEVTRGNTTILLRSIGSTLFMSTDCKTVISGAPATVFRVKQENGAEEDLPEVGAVVVFEEGSSGWQMTHVLYPDKLEAGGGYGRRLAASSDVKYYSAAYFNHIGEGDHDNGMVYVSMETSVDEWSSPLLLSVPEGADTSKFGNALQFIDASSLLVGSSDGVLMYKKTTNNGKMDWYLRRNMSLSTITALNKYTTVGEYVGMPENGQDFVAISARASDYDGVVFMKRNDTDNTWRYSFDIQLPKGAAGPIDFCRDRYMAMLGSITEGGKKKTAVLMFEKGPNGNFRWTENITQPPEDEDESKHMNYASSFAWDNDHCFRFAVGSMSKTRTEAGEHVPYEYGAVHVYQRDFVPGSSITRQYVPLVAVLTAFFGLLFVSIIVTVIIYFCIKFKRWWGSRRSVPLPQDELL